MFGKSKFWPISVILAAIALRLFLYQKNGEVQSLAYWTIIGRIDQFALGMLAFHFRSCVRGRHALVVLIVLAFMAFYWYFDRKGGFYKYPSYPSPSPLWIILPTIEGFVYAVAIAWYDNSFTHSVTGFSKAIGRIGEYSYSIYLLHFFVVFHVAKFVHAHVMGISNFYLACLWSLVFYVFMLIPAYVSFRFIEKPFLKLRKRYIKNTHSRPVKDLLVPK